MAAEKVGVLFGPLACGGDEARREMGQSVGDSLGAFGRKETGLAAVAGIGELADRLAYGVGEFHGQGGESEGVAGVAGEVAVGVDGGADGGEQVAGDAAVYAHAHTFYLGLAAEASAAAGKAQLGVRVD